MADKWIQLMSEDGTDNLFPVSKMDLLWKNASPTSAFAAQTVSLDLSKYSHLYIVFNFSYVSAFKRVGEPVIVGGGEARMWCTTKDAETDRPCIATTTGVQFGAGYLDGNANNNYVVPTEIYGAN